MWPENWKWSKIFISYVDVLPDSQKMSKKINKWKRKKLTTYMGIIIIIKIFADHPGNSKINLIFCFLEQNLSVLLLVEVWGLSTTLKL